VRRQSLGNIDSTWKSSRRFHQVVTCDAVKLAVSCPNKFNPLRRPVAHRAVRNAYAKYHVFRFTSGNAKAKQVSPGAAKRARASSRSREKVLEGLSPLRISFLRRREKFSVRGDDLDTRDSFARGRFRAPSFPRSGLSLSA